MKVKYWIIGCLIFVIIILALLFLVNPSAKSVKGCTQLSLFDSFIDNPFNSDVGTINQNNQKEAQVVGELVKIGKAEFQPNKNGSSNYKREVTFKGNNEQKTFTYVFPDNTDLRGLGSNNSLLDNLEIGKTYQLRLLANPPSPTISIYLTDYKFFKCN